MKRVKTSLILLVALLFSLPLGGPGAARAQSSASDDLFNAMQDTLSSSGGNSRQKKRAPPARKPQVQQYQQQYRQPQQQYRQPARAAAPAAPATRRRVPAQAAPQEAQPQQGQTLSTGMSFREWTEKLLSAFERTPVVIQIRRNYRLNELSEEAALLQSPLTLGATVSRFTDPQDTQFGGTHTLNKYTLSPSLTFQENSGWSGQLKLSNDHYFSDVPKDDNPTNYGKDLTMSLGVSKELIREGGDGGSGKTRAKAAAIGFRASRINAEASIWLRRVDYYALLANIFATECKILGIERQKKGVASAIEIGKVQLSTRTISYEQYLQFIELENNFARQIASQETIRAGLVQDALQWGGEVQRAAERLHEITPDCSYDLDETMARVQNLLLEERDIDSLARSMPSYVAKDLLRETEELSLKAAELGNKPSLTAQVSTDYNKVAPVEKEKTTYTVGVTLSWGIPTRKTSLDEETKKASIANASSELRSTYFDNVKTIRKLQNEIRTQNTVVPILRKSLEASGKTLSIMATKRSIGEVDALGYQSASINYNEANSALLDSWINLEQSLFQLNGLRQYFRSTTRRPENQEPKPRGYDLDL